MSRLAAWARLPRPHHRDVQGVVHYGHVGGRAWCNRDLYDYTGGRTMAATHPVTCLWCHSGYEAEPLDVE